MIDDYIIDPELQAVLPVNDAATLARLEGELKKYGCLDPLRVWGKIVVDGMTRLPICRANNIKFRVVEMKFESREEAKLWIILNQLSRRDLTDNRYKYYLGLLYKSRKEDSHVNGKESKGTTVLKDLAEETGVSEKTLQRAEDFSDAIDDLADVPELREAILDETVSVSAGEVKNLAEMPKKERKTRAKAILAGEPTNLSESAEDEKPIYDSLGEIVKDAWLQEVFVEVETFYELLREIKGLDAKLKRLARTAGGATLHENELSLRRIKDELECRIPWVKCTTCKGSKTIMVNETRTECPDCSALGWMTNFSYTRKENKRKKK